MAVDFDQNWTDFFNENKPVTIMQGNLFGHRDIEWTLQINGNDNVYVEVEQMISDHKRNNEDAFNDEGLTITALVDIEKFWRNKGMDVEIEGDMDPDSPDYPYDSQLYVILPLDPEAPGTFGDVYNEEIEPFLTATKDALDSNSPDYVFKTA